MLAAAKKAGVRVALISPNAVEVRNKPQNKTYLETQAKFYARSKDLAAKFDDPFVDQYAVTRKVLEKMTANELPTKAFPDSVHTNAAGGLLMAMILKGLEDAERRCQKGGGGGARARGHGGKKKKKNIARPTELSVLWSVLARCRLPRGGGTGQWRLRAVSIVVAKPAHQRAFAARRAAVPTLSARRRRSSSATGSAVHQDRCPARSWSSRCGYTVTAAQEGAEAVQLAGPPSRRPSRRAQARALRRRCGLAAGGSLRPACFGCGGG